MSTHETPIVQLGEVFAHPNADALELTKVFGWQCALKKGQHKTGDLMAFIQPDYLVDTRRQEFAFLASKAKADGMARIGAMKLRGHISYGLLIPAPTGHKEGDNVMDVLGVQRYEPPMDVRMGGTHAQAPVGDAPKFDLENIERFMDVFEPGEEVIATEKIHGCNARYMWDGERMHVGSRTGWYKPDSDDVWNATLKLYPEIESLCKEYPGHVLYGEIYGTTQDLRYGSPSKHKFAAFAMLARKDGYWANPDDLRYECERFGIHMPPRVYRGPFDFKALQEVAEGDSIEAKLNGSNHLMEGVVIVPVRERLHAVHGRVAMKLVSSRYLSR